MKIFLSGAQGTGKSTINKELSKHELLKDFEIMDSISSKFATNKDTFKNPRKLLEFQLKIAFYCFNKYINTENLLSSRSFADTYAYAKYEYELTRLEFYKVLANMALETQKALDTLEIMENRQKIKYIYVPIMFDLQEKNLRSTNKIFQERIDYLIKEFFEKSGSELYTIKSLENQGRVQEIIDYCFKERI